MKICAARCANQKATVSSEIQWQKFLISCRIFIIHNFHIFSHSSHCSRPSMWSWASKSAALPSVGFAACWRQFHLHKKAFSWSAQEPRLKNSYMTKAWAALTRLTNDKMWQGVTSKNTRYLRPVCPLRFPNELQELDFQRVEHVGIQELAMIISMVRVSWHVENALVIDSIHDQTNPNNSCKHRQTRTRTNEECANWG